jgi:hypothetical protein
LQPPVLLRTFSGESVSGVPAQYTNLQPIR